MTEPIRTDHAGRPRRALWPLLAAATFAALAPGIAPAQTDSVTVVPGADYAVGPLRSWLFGRDYRDLWTMPIRVAILDLQSYAGGLTPTEEGGGMQTRSLRFRGADGREYRFRSVQKFPDRARHPDLAGALAADLLQDQVSSSVPAAPVVAGRIAAAVGLLHPIADLFVMPDDPRLGSFQAEFAGMLGTLEEHPNEGENGSPGFGGFDRITATDAFLEALEESAANRLDARTYLRARLTDLILGDWDRHADQWRWVRTASGSDTLWTPIPRDRDYAFVEYDGALLNVVRRLASNATRFSAGYSDLTGLILNAAELDRRLLSSLDRAAWDSVTASLRADLTDAEIDAALLHLPAGFRQSRGAQIGAELRARRDGLGPAAARYYEILARAPEIHTTDDAERATVTRYPDGQVDVQVVGPSGRTTYLRRFVPEDTREIRLDLHGGDDRAVVRGAANRGIRVRLIGGGGADLLADSSTVARLGRWTTLHDEGDETVFITHGATGVDRRSFEETPFNADGMIPIRPPVTGTRLSFGPSIDYSTTRGFLVGAGVESTRYAFRRDPWASRIRLDTQLSTRWRDVGVELTGAVRSSDPELSARSTLLATRIDATRFYGFGNETPDDLPSELYVARRERFEASADVRYEIAPRIALMGGAVGTRSKPWLVAGGPLAEQMPLGSDGYSSFGLRGGIETLQPYDSVSTGLTARVAGSFFPVSQGRGAYFANTALESALRIPLGSGGLTSVAARAGGKYVFGDYPFFEAAYLGGGETLRGFPRWRFAGDAAVYGGAEASAYLGRLPIFANWRVAGFVFGDVGRVFLQDERSDAWHAAPGIGFSFTALDFTARASYAHGPEPRLYLETGLPY